MDKLPFDAMLEMRAEAIRKGLTPACWEMSLAAEWALRKDERVYRDEVHDYRERRILSIPFKIVEEMATAENRGPIRDLNLEQASITLITEQRVTVSLTPRDDIQHVAQP